MDGFLAGGGEELSAERLKKQSIKLSRLSLNSTAGVLITTQQN